MMAGAESPFGIDRARHQDLAKRGHHVWWRRVVLSVVAVIPVLALFNVFGQHGILQVAISYLGFRVRRMRPFLQGEPIVLVENGQVIERNLRRERLTTDDLAEKARLSEIESPEQIKWAVLETNGDISFIKQPAS